MNIKFLPAYNGDCILVSHQSENGSINILIDGGIARTYPQTLKDVILGLKKKKEKINLLILTHVDDDHIGGIIKFFEDSSIDKSIINKVWFNSGKNISKFFDTTEKKSRNVVIIPDTVTDMSISDGITLESELKNNNLTDEIIIKCGDEYKIQNMKIKILSPDTNSLEKLNNRWTREVDKRTKMSEKSKNDYMYPLSKLKAVHFKEDRSIPNRSPIALLIEVEDKKALLLGDAVPSIIVKSLNKIGYNSENPLKVDVVKLAHHGSKKNTNYELLRVVECTNYVISTDGSSHNLPNKAVFARILKMYPNAIFYFNYKNEVLESIFDFKDTLEFNFTCKYLSDVNYNIVI